MKRRDVILIGGICLLALFLFWILPVGGTGQMVNISVSGKHYGKYALYVDRTLTIETETGSNTIVIFNGKVSVSAATCSDKLCTRMPEISQKHESIVCLPHGLVIEIIGADDADAVVALPLYRKECS